jgi:hypothetical protein
MTIVTALLLAAIVLLAYVAQGITGFGSVIIALTLAALFLPIAFLVPILAALNIPVCGWLIWRERAEINWQLLRREVMPLMSLGGIAGMLSSAPLADVGLRKPFGALVLAMATLELWRLYHRRQPRPRPLVKGGLLLASGFAQGLYASGGPLLAAALAGSSLHKSAMRASLLVVWMVFNTALTVLFLARGQFTQEVTTAVLWLLPVSFVGLKLGDLLHERVNEWQFRLLTNVLLLVSGVALLS